NKPPTAPATHSSSNNNNESTPAPTPAAAPVVPSDPRSPTSPASATTPTAPISFASAAAKARAAPPSVATPAAAPEVNGKGGKGQNAANGRPPSRHAGQNGVPREGPVTFKQGAYKQGGSRQAPGPATGKRPAFGSFAEAANVDGEKSAELTTATANAQQSAGGAAEDAVENGNNPTTVQPTPRTAAASLAATMDAEFPRTMSAPPKLDKAKKPNFQTASKIESTEKEAEASAPATTETQPSAPQTTQEAVAVATQQPAAATAAPAPALATIPTSPTTSAHVPAPIPQTQAPAHTQHQPHPQQQPQPQRRPSVNNQHPQQFHMQHPGQHHFPHHGHQQQHHQQGHFQHQQGHRQHNVRPQGNMGPGPQYNKQFRPQQHHVPGSQPLVGGMSQPGMGQQMPAVVPQMWQQGQYMPQQHFYPQQYDPYFQQQMYGYPGYAVPQPMMRPPIPPQAAQGQYRPHAAAAPQTASAELVRPRAASIKIVNPNTNEEVTLPKTAPATPAKQPSAPAPAAAAASTEKPAPKPEEVTPRKPAAPIVIRDPVTGDIITKGIRITKPTDAAPKEKEEVKEEGAKEVKAEKEEKEVKKAEEVKEEKVEAPKVEEKAAPVKEVKAEAPVEVKVEEKKDVEKPKEVVAEKPAALDTKSAAADAAKSPASPIKSPTKAAAEGILSKTAAKKKKKEEKAKQEEKVKEEEKKEEAPVEAEAKTEAPAVVPETKAPEAAAPEPAKEEKEPVVEKKEEPARAKGSEETPASTEESEKTETELEDGEIAESSAASVTTGTESPAPEVARRSASPVPDSVTPPETADAKPQKPKLSVRTPVSMKRLDSFDGIKYPPTIESPTVVKGGPFKYKRDFLMSFMEVAKDRPQGLPTEKEIYGDGDRVSSPGGKRGSQGPGARPGMQRQGSHSDVNRGGAMPKSSEERFQQHMANRVTGLMGGVMGPIGAPPGGRMVRGGSGGGGMPTISRQGSGTGFRGGDRRDGGRDSRSGRGGRREPPTPVPQTPLEPVEPLQKSESGWKPASLVKGATLPVKTVEGLSEEEAAELAVIERKTKGLLNKLTIEKFDAISDQILHVGMKNQALLRTVIELVFEKAIDEPNFGSMYAQLCARLSTELPKVETWVELDAKNNVFRRSLLNKCQEEFEKAEKWSNDDSSSLEERRERRKHLESLSSEEKQKIAEEDYQRGKLKRRVLGNMAFIGELFIKGMLSEKIMHACITQMLKNVNEPEEEEIESLCKLMTTVGARLDHDKATHIMEAYFGRIKELSANKKLNSRIRFMLLDLQDLRKDGWKSRNAPTGPKTIAEIHAEAERKAAEEAERIKQANRSSGGSR
ncbi:hypothetical protein HK097_004261, partial [Rhizophlyctis rosea]